MLAIPRMRVEDCAEKNRCNPFARYLVDTPAAPSSTVGRMICQSVTGRLSVCLSVCQPLSDLSPTRLSDCLIILISKSASLFHLSLSLIYNRPYLSHSLTYSWKYLFYRFSRQMANGSHVTYSWRVHMGGGGGGGGQRRAFYFLPHMF